MRKDKVHSLILDIAKELAKKRHGALFVIGKEDEFKGVYDLLFPQVISKVCIDKHGMEKVLDKLAVLDGAVLISDRGMLLAYGARLRTVKTIRGFGTRHAAAAGVTRRIKNSVAILVSEEVNWVKVFRDGKIILELDPMVEHPTRIKKQIISFITYKDAALLTAAGASAALLGVAPTLILGGTYLAIKTATGVIRKKLSKVK